VRRESSGNGTFEGRIVFENRRFSSLGCRLGQFNDRLAQANLGLLKETSDIVEAG
jgi:hypothetical protein